MVKVKFKLKGLKDGDGWGDVQMTSRRYGRYKFELRRGLGHVKYVYKYVWQVNRLVTIATYKQQKK